MKSIEEVIEIAVGENGSHSSRMEALDKIEDKRVLKYLAEHAADDWIKLESAIRGEIRSVLVSLKNHPDERISLEASIELDDQERLADLVMHSKDNLLKDIAINYLEDDCLLKRVINTSKNEKDRVMAALRLGDIPLNRELMVELKDENLILKMAQFLNDEPAMSELYTNTADSRIRKIAGDWIKGFNAES